MAFRGYRIDEHVGHPETRQAGEYQVGSERREGITVEDAVDAGHQQELAAEHSGGCRARQQQGHVEADHVLADNALAEVLRERAASHGRHRNRE